MNQNILNELTTGLIDGGYSDLKFLIDTIEKYKLSVDDILDKHSENFWEVKMVQINYLIYTALTLVASNFIKENEKLFKKYNDEHQIYTNYLDSWIWWEEQGKKGIGWIKIVKITVNLYILTTLWYLLKELKRWKHLQNLA